MLQTFGMFRFKISGDVVVAASSHVTSLRAEHSFEHMNCNSPNDASGRACLGPWKNHSKEREGWDYPTRFLNQWYTVFLPIGGPQDSKFCCGSVRTCQVATFSRANPIEGVLQSYLWLIFRAWRRIWNIACAHRRGSLCQSHPLWGISL